MEQPFGDDDNDLPLTGYQVEFDKELTLNYSKVTSFKPISNGCNDILSINRTQFKTVAKFCKTVAAATSILMPILVPLVLVTLQSSETNTKSTSASKSTSPPPPCYKISAPS